MAGFFDTLFSGGAEREAADRNRTALNTYTMDSLGALTRGLNRSEDAARTGVNSANAYQGGNYGLYGDLRNTGNGILDRGRADSLATLGGTANNYAGLQAKYGAGTDLYLD